MSGILITGAAKRIGRQLAIDLAAAGHDIAIHYNSSRPEAEDVAKIMGGNLMKLMKVSKPAKKPVSA